MAYLTGTSDAVALANANISFIDGLKSEAESALGQLEGLAMSSIGAIYNPDEWGNGQGSAVDTVVEEIDKLDINEIPTVDDIIGKINDIQVGVLPDAPSSDAIEKYKKHIWEGPQLDAIQTLLTSYMQDMGMPPAAFKDALFDESKERKQRILSDRIDRVLARTSARGFRYAQGMTFAEIQEEENKYDDELQNLDREITKLLTEWARQNFQFAIQQGIAIEQAHMDFAYKYSSIFREVYTTQVNAVLDIYKAKVSLELAQLDAKVKAIMARADILKINAELEGTETKLKLMVDELQVKEAVARYQGVLQSSKDIMTFQLGAAQHRATTAATMLSAVSVSSLGVTIGKSK